MVFLHTVYLKRLILKIKRTSLFKPIIRVLQIEIIFQASSSVIFHDPNISGIAKDICHTALHRNRICEGKKWYLDASTSPRPALELVKSISVVEIQVESSKTSRARPDRKQFERKLIGVTFADVQRKDQTSWLSFGRSLSLSDMQRNCGSPAIRLFPRGYLEDRQAFKKLGTNRLLDVQRKGPCLIIWLCPQSPAEWSWTPLCFRCATKPRLMCVSEKGCSSRCATKMSSWDWTDALKKST